MEPCWASASRPGKSRPALELKPARRQRVIKRHKGFARSVRSQAPLIAVQLYRPRFLFRVLNLMLRSTTHRKRYRPDEIEAALPSGPHNGPTLLAREVSAPAASLTRGITPQADSSGSTSASPSPASSPVSHGRMSLRGHAQREERSDCAVAQTTTRSDTPLRARSRSAADAAAHCDSGQATGEGEVSFRQKEREDAAAQEQVSAKQKNNSGKKKRKARKPNSKRSGSRRRAARVERNEGWTGPPLADAIELVDAIFARRNPVDVSVRLLGSEDDRISSRHLERLYEMRFGKPSAAPGSDPDAPPAIEWNLPRPDRSDTT